MDNNIITFFHTSHTLVNKFKTKNDRHLFYWFSDSYHSHDIIRDYFYLFVKPVKEIDFITRHDQGGIDSVIQYFNEYKKTREKILNNESDRKYTEPTIILSKSLLKPDLVLKREGNYFIVLEPEIFKRIKIKLFNNMPSNIYDFFKKEYSPINFLNINELNKIIPEIKDSINFK